MTYSDQEILDLYDHLQGIGLSETPEEEAERHRLAAEGTFQASPDSYTKFPSSGILQYIIKNSIPCTYLLMVKKNLLNGKQTTVIFPVVRGQVLMQYGCVSLEEYICGTQDQKDIYLVSKHQDLQDLKSSLLLAKEKFPEIDLEKYLFLNHI